MRDIRTIKVLDAVAIDASGNTTSEAIPIKEYAPEGFFSIQITTAGASSQVKVEYLLSHDGITYSDCGSDITTGFGPGTNIYAFPDGEPMVAPYMKIKVTETAGNAVSACTVYLCFQ